VAVSYRSIIADYQAYLNRLADPNDAGVDGQLNEILEYLAAVEKQDLSNPLVGLKDAYAYRPPGVGGPTPFIVHVPLNTEITPISTLDDGGIGMIYEVRYHVDVLIAGGHDKIPYGEVMRIAKGLFIPTVMLLQKNQDTGGLSRGLVIDGDDPATLPFPNTITSTPLVTWQGIAIHTYIDCMYGWRTV
jgi:hypothetical protein